MPHMDGAGPNRQGWRYPRAGLTTQRSLVLAFALLLSGLLAGCSSGLSIPQAQTAVNKWHDQVEADQYYLSGISNDVNDNWQTAGCKPIQKNERLPAWAASIFDDGGKGRYYCPSQSYESKNRIRLEKKLNNDEYQLQVAQDELKKAENG